MGAGEKFRVLKGEARTASEKADQALKGAATVAVHVRQLALASGLEEVQEPAGEGMVRIRYRRRLPRWLAWVRKVGVAR